MQKFKVWHGLTVIVAAGVMAFVGAQVANSIGSLQLAKNSGHENFSHEKFNPRFYASTPSTTAEDVSIYCPGIKRNDRIFLALVCDSGTTNSVRFNDLTDSCYIQDNDTVRFSQALLVTSEMLIGWQKTTD